MKKQLLVLSLSLLAILAQAQVNVKFGINHLVNGAELTTNTIGNNDVKNDFSIARLEYYISEIKIVHDGGTVTDVQDKYILVNAFTPEMADLGELDVTTVEAITFSIGVNQPVNNEDPTQWPAEHALAPKFPSMHWGWAAGYRFVALEGKTGMTLNTTYEIHALGAQNYFTTTVETEAKMVDGSLVIALNADYANALAGIDISSGIISHGDFGQSIDLLENFRDNVFTTGDGVVSTQEAPQPVLIDVYPNPSRGTFTLTSSADQPTQTLEVIDLQGKTIETLTLQGNASVQLDITKPGMYMVRLYSTNGYVGSQRLTVL